MCVWVNLCVLFKSKNIPKMLFFLFDFPFVFLFIYLFSDFVFVIMEVEDALFECNDDDGNRDWTIWTSLANPKNGP